MQTIALARTLTRHRAAAAPKPTIPTPKREPARPHPLLTAIARQRRAQQRTMMEMARDREAVRHSWQ